MASQNGLLEVQDMTVRFGGLVAVDTLSFGVEEGELLGIIGPNGAGKTTAFNAIAGSVRPTSGRIVLGGNRLDRLSPEKVARRGVARTFQSVRLCRTMTVAENVALAASSVAGSLSAANAAATEAMRTVHIEHLADRPVTELPLADQKRVETARALALSPRVLLLDEMMSGLNGPETEEIIEVVRNLNGGGLTVIVIEHVLRVIMTLSQRLLVLDHGKLIAHGSPQQVMDDPKVAEAYLGRNQARRLGSGT